MYDAKEQLPDCIRSVLNQTLSDLELILVEDGSPNGCGELCDEWALKDPRIQVIHKPNGGPASASNAGLEAATGDYIGFVDSDDIIEPNFYETLYKALKENDCQIAACGAEGIDEEGRPLPDIIVQSQNTGKMDALDLFYDIFQTGTMYGMLSWNKLFDARLYRERNVRYDEKMFFGDDASILHLLYDGASIYCMNDKLYHYRTRTGSITSAAFPPRKLDDLTMYWDWLLWFRARGDKPDLTQWAIACYWRVFYIFYVMAADSGTLKLPQVKEGFAFHKTHLDSLLKDIQACPYVSRFEKLRARLFCASPALAYRLARLWGKAHG
ncbi:MAG: glycosyltransferase [Oscillospiraceae bacterium]|nr:glycosyltransferase [Oscillospiraceae bacterium]